MNQIAFFEEVVNSDICPENFESIYNSFINFQNDALLTLKEFHRVCEKNKIPYQLAFGSLLGVIRDSGQIPWDYDIDVLVPYSSKNDLINALKTDLSEDYYFYCPENNDECRHVIMRLAPKTYRTEVLHVDVFYFVGSPNSNFERKRFAKSIKKLSHSHFLKLVKPVEESAGNVKYLLSLLKGKITVSLISVSKLREEYNDLCNKYPISASEYCVEADSFADLYEIPTKYLLNTKLIKTGIGEFRISNYYKELLMIWYRDYMNIPPLESRIKEVLHNMKRLAYFEKI